MEGEKNRHDYNGIEIHEVVSEWDAVFTVCGVPEKDVESIGKDIIQRLKKTSTSL